MDVLEKDLNNLKGIFIQRVRKGKDGQPETVQPIGYRYKQVSFIRKPDETEDELQARCIKSVAPWIPYTTDGLEPHALFSAINEGDDV